MASYIRIQYFKKESPDKTTQNSPGSKNFVNQLTAQVIKMVAKTLIITSLASLITLNAASQPTESTQTVRWRRFGNVEMAAVVAAPSAGGSGSGGNVNAQAGPPVSSAASTSTRTNGAPPSAPTNTNVNTNTNAPTNTNTRVLI